MRPMPRQPSWRSASLLALSPKGQWRETPPWFNLLRKGDNNGP
jgi:hypothetical protein